MTLESDAKFEEKLTRRFKSDMKFGRFSPQHSKVSKF